MGEARNFAPIPSTLEKAGGILTPEGAVGFGWMAQDLDPSGAMGDAASADAGRGAILVERAARALVQLCTEVASYPLERITARTIYTNG